MLGLMTEHLIGSKYLSCLRRKKQFSFPKSCWLGVNIRSSLLSGKGTEPIDQEPNEGMRAKAWTTKSEFMYSYEDRILAVEC